MAVVFKSCYRCKERYVGCHSVCPKYIKEKEEWEKVKKIIEKNKAPVLTTYDFNAIDYNRQKRYRRGLK